MKMKAGGYIPSSNENLQIKLTVNELKLIKNALEFYIDICYRNEKIEVSLLRERIANALNRIKHNTKAELETEK